MQGAIYLLDSEGRLVEMHESAYATEALLQQLLEKHPHLLAGEQMNTAAPRRWLLVSREMAVPGEEGAAARGYLDHLFVDQDAIPTLVEVKRSSDTRIRREVVGQMLDYAANAVISWPVERIRSQFESRCRQEQLDDSEILMMFIGAEADPEEFWQRVKTNLQAGKIRLVFVADIIPSGLRRIVEFLNEQMDPAEVLAVEIRQYEGQGLRTLVPRVIGQTTKAEDRKMVASGEKRRWDEASFFAEMEAKRTPGEVAVARRVFDWVRSNSISFTWGKGVTAGSLLPYIEHKGETYWPFSVWTYGSIEILFQWLKYRAPFDAEGKRLDLLQRLNAIPGVSIPENGITRRPPIRMSAIAAEGSVERLIETLGWVVEEIQASQ